MKNTINHITRKRIMKTRRNSTQDRFFKVKIDVINVETQNAEKGSNVLLENINAETVTGLVILVACATKNKILTWRDLDHQRQLTSGRLSAEDKSMYRNSSDSSSSEDESFCLQMKVEAKQADDKYPVPKHLFTNLEFKVKPHKNKTKFLWARVDTCADANSMPVSMYKYLFKDPDCAKIASSDLQLGKYTNKKVKIFGSCNLYVIHPDTRCIEEMPFFVASNEGSILISCAISLALGLIKPHESWTIYPWGK